MFKQEELGKIKLVISDCHLSAGRVFESRLNVHEDFYFDDELTDFIEYFSSGHYDEGINGAVDVELFINGDFFDFLNVPYQGDFEDAITEEISLWKLEAILTGHPKVIQALRQFASKPGKSISYLIGNHDADLFFPSIQKRITEALDPQDRFPSPCVQVIADRDRVRWEGGIEVRHGNQFEAVHVLNFEQPFLHSGPKGELILNLPWGSFYVLKIVNRLKWEREYLDKVRPVRLFVLIGLIVDPLFTLRFVVHSIYYFLKTRFVYSSRRRSKLKVTAEILSQETNFLLDLERAARRLLDQDKELMTIIFGHTHKPMNKIFADGKQYINTGTWTKMINLDWRNLGQQFCLTFAYIHIKNGQAHAELREWKGTDGPHAPYRN